MHPKTIPAPPSGYRSWLEYAIATFDSRTPTFELEASDEPSITREEMIQAVWAEFNELRKQAGLLPTSPNQ